ncbi:hypothetical protein BJ742DRAFT_768926 [Cladochytrium replicatum]|nr:hypothetical protein BJ742DRAFT_768926 [Cladochytrium replicatum]
MRRIEGVLSAVDESIELEEMHHGDRVQGGCADLWCKEVDEEVRSLSRMVMMNALAAVGWVVWNEEGELRLIPALSGGQVAFQTCRDEMMNGVQAVLKWIKRTLTFSGSNEVDEKIPAALVNVS